MEILWLLLTIPFAGWLLMLLIKLVAQISKPPFISSEVYHNKSILAAEILFTVIAPAVGFVRYQEFPPEFPFAEKHLFTLIFLVVVSINSYWASRLYKSHQAPLVAALIPLGIFQGILINLALLIHFNFYVLMGVAFPVFGFELVAPLINIFLFVRELYFGHLYFRQNLEPSSFSNPNFLIRFLLTFNLRRKSLTYFILWMPFFVVQQSILVLLGQKPDAAVRVFVESCGFTFSDPSYCPPPPDHYLCSIAVHGSPRWVRPLRKGMRWGFGITVNRQLLIANAFEQWLEEHHPKAHRVLRGFYDALKIPVAAWSKNKWLANILYVLMKPLEWVFLAWLYLTDEKPENRIATQYLPKKYK